MKAKRTEHFKNPRGLQKFSTADIPNLKCNLVGKLPNNQRKLITEGQPLILEIVVKETEDVKNEEP